MSVTSVLRWVCLMTAAGLFVGCAAGAPAPTFAPDSNVPTPSAAPVSAFPPGLTDVEIAQAVEFRALVGLRADEIWIREVAADPRRVMTFDVPLQLDEAALLEARPQDFQAIRDVLQEYSSAHPGEFAGIFIDPPGGRHFVITFTDRLDAHRAALATLLHPFADVELRLAPTSTRDLTALFDRIAKDEDQLRALGIVVVTASLNEQTATVDLELSAERPDAVGAVEWRYGVSVRATVVDPTGAFLKPRGTIAGRTTDPSGDGVPALVGIAPLFADIPMDSVGYEPNPDGSFLFPNTLAGRWRITAELEGYGPAAADVDVPPGGVATIELVLVRTP